MTEPQFRTNDIFVSYSRKDKPFVERLVKAFQNAGRDVWVDWEDIPLTAEWREEIRKGIEEADNFVIVISPDAMRSEVILNTEIAHAVKHNKRIVPILYRRLEPDQKAPDTVRSHNWIYFREEDDFDAAFTGLIAALNTDLEYVQAHTRVTTKAVQWERNNRDRSYLLRGHDLSHSQTWLSQVADKEPPVTSLQSEFIYESGKHERSLGRRMLIAVTFALLVSVALMVMSVVFYRQAVAAQELAEDKTRVVQSLELAANSQVALNSMSDGDLAIALALESVQKVGFPPVQAQLALAEAAYSPGTLFNLEGHSAAITALGVAEGAAFIVTADADGRIIFHNLETGETAATIDMFAPVIDIYPAAGQNEVLVLSESGMGTHVELMRPLDGEVVTEEVMFVEGESDRYQVMSYFPPENSLAAVNGAGRVDVWVGTEEVITFALWTTAESIQFSPDGQQVVVATSDGQLTVFDTFTGEEVVRMEVENVEGDKTSLVFNPGGDLLVAGTSVSNVVAVWDVETGRLIDRFFGHSDTVYDVYFGDSGSVLISGSQDGAVILWDVESGLQLREFVGHDSSVQVVTHMDSLDYILSGAANGTVRLWDAHNGAVLSIFHDHHSKVHTVAYSPDGRTVMSGARDGELYVWETRDADASDVIFIQAHDEVIWDVDYNPRNPAEGLSASEEGTVRVWDLQTATEKFAFTGHEAPVWAAEFHPSGEQILSADDKGQAILWNAVTGEEILRVDGHRGVRVRAVAFSPDGRRFATGGADNTVAIWDTETGDEVLRFTEHADWIWSIDYSDDGTRIASSAAESAIYVWDAETGEVYFRLEGHAGPVYDVEFDSNAMTLLSSASDSTIRLWNLRDGREIRRYVEHSQGVWGIAFSPDDRQFVSGAGDHTVALWTVVVRIEELVEWTLENRFVRELTCDERVMFNVDPQCEGEFASSTSDADYQ